MRTTILCGALALVAGCAAAGDRIAEVEPHGEGRCDGSAAQRFIGETLDRALPNAARRAAGARAVRVIRPGDAVTMDFRTDRLNVELDAADKVMRLRCG